MTPAGLAEALGHLPVAVEAIGCRFALVPVQGYGVPGRPATFLELSGHGQTGFGELVSFTVEEHLDFRDRAPGLLRGRCGRVADLVAGGTPHEGAAVEGALIDLALRQAGRSLGDLCGRPTARLRWVASFAASAEPDAALSTAELKLDVHPDWSEGVLADLGRRPVAILDWKGRGTREQARRLSAAFPEAIFEDPPEGSGHARIARDQPLGGAEQVRAALARGELVNLKAPRMGGFLELLRGLDAALATAPSPSVYFGGMFEIGPAREQARQLAALFCPGAPNDLAPFPGGSCSLEGPSPSAIRLDRPGFGANLDWSSGPSGPAGIRSP